MINLKVITNGCIMKLGYNDTRVNNPHAMAKTQCHNDHLCSGNTSVILTLMTSEREAEGRMAVAKT